MAKSAAERISRNSRLRIYRNNGNICHYCGEKFEDSELTLDHVFPRSRYKRYDVQWNLVPSCSPCNKNKDALDPKLSSIMHVSKRKRQFDTMMDAINRFREIKKKENKVNRKYLLALRKIHETMQVKYYGEIVSHG